MTANTFGWRAHLIVDDYGRTTRLVLVRDVGDGRVEVNMRDGSWLRTDADVVADPSPGYVLPMGAWDAIVELVLPKAKDGEIALLKDALSVERARVDQVLDRSITRNVGS